MCPGGVELSAVKFARVIFLLFLASMPVCCRAGGDRSPVIVTLNGHDIHRDEFEHFLELKMGEFSATETSGPLRSQILDEYLKRRLVLDDAGRLGLSVLADEIDQAT